MDTTTKTIFIRKLHVSLADIFWAVVVFVLASLALLNVKAEDGCIPNPTNGPVLLNPLNGEVILQNGVVFPNDGKRVTYLNGCVTILPEVIFKNGME